MFKVVFKPFQPASIAEQQVPDSAYLSYLSFISADSASSPNPPGQPSTFKISPSKST